MYEFRSVGDLSQETSDIASDFTITIRCVGATLAPEEELWHHQDVKDRGIVASILAHIPCLLDGSRQQLDTDANVHFGVALDSNVLAVHISRAVGIANLRIY